MKTSTCTRWRKTSGKTQTYMRQSPATPTRRPSSTKVSPCSSLRRGHGVHVGSLSVDLGGNSGDGGSVGSFLSILDETLWTEVERLSAVTDRLHQRLAEVRDELASDYDTTAVSRASLPLNTRPNMSPLKCPVQSQLQRQGLGEDLPYTASFIPGNFHAKVDKVLSKFTSPRRPPAQKENDESVLTSLMSFQYTPRVETSHKKCRNGTKREDFVDEEENGDVDDKGGLEFSAAAPVVNAPLVVELPKPNSTDVVKPKITEMNVTPTREAAKHMLLQAQILSIEQDLNHYMADLLVLQRDVLDAQKQGLTNPNDSSVRELRLSLRDELNACSNRIATLESLRSLIPDEAAVSKTVS